MAQQGCSRKKIAETTGISEKKVRQAKEMARLFAECNAVIPVASNKQELARKAIEDLSLYVAVKNRCGQESVKQFILKLSAVLLCGNTGKQSGPGVGPTFPRGNPGPGVGPTLENRRCKRWKE